MGDGVSRLPCFRGKADGLAKGLDVGLHHSGIAYSLPSKDSAFNAEGKKSSISYSSQCACTISSSGRYISWEAIHGNHLTTVYSTSGELPAAYMAWVFLGISA